MFKLVLSTNFQIANNQLYIYRAYFALALGVLLFLSACTSTNLTALENAASIIQLQTGREVDRFARDKGTGITGPIYAKIRIDYEPVNSYTVKEVYDEIVAILEKNDWKGRECTACNSPAFRASLQQVDWRIPLYISIVVVPDENVVRIRIENLNL